MKGVSVITWSYQFCVRYMQHILRHTHVFTQWRHNGRDGVSNCQRLDCLLNRLFGRWSKKTSKLRFSGLCGGNSPVTGEFPHKEPVTRKMLPLDDVSMPLFVNSWDIFRDILYGWFKGIRLPQCQWNINGNMLNTSLAVTIVIIWVHWNKAQHNAQCWLMSGYTLPCMR